MLAYIVPGLLIFIPAVSIAVGGIAGIPVAIILDIILIALSIRIVKPNTVMAVEFLGRFDRVLRSGLNFIIPVLETTKTQVLFRRNFDVNVEGVTYDNVTAYIGLNVIYYVQDDKNDTPDGAIYRSIYSIDDPRTMIRSTVDEQLRGMIVTFTHKNVFEKREEIGDAIWERLKERLGTFGHKIDSIQVRDIKLEASVMTAMNKVIESEKLKEAAMNEGEAEKIMQVKKAEGERESRILLGAGMAGQRTKIAEGFKEAVAMIKAADDSLNGALVLEFLLDSSRIETLGNIGEKNAKIIYLNEDLEGKGLNKTLSKGEKLIAGSELMGKEVPQR
ncbi:hypothetical protein LAT59_01030 [Candidatus Gracilibacteria bacterium]|nr:hypothetical protein [Candidatus Gracilibacteria bacterium]